MIEQTIFAAYFGGVPLFAGVRAGEALLPALGVALPLPL